ncbi:MAG TPA: D-alanyl-D-alanine carboxypeptidase family protein [Dissulfurispiraceae bacterium]
MKTNAGVRAWQVAILISLLGLVLSRGHAFAGDVGARAAVVIDSSTEKILYAKNPNWKLPPASTTKLITSMVALDRLNPDSVITISENAANTPSVSPRLRPGERFTVREVLHLALMRSVNSAAVALAEAAAGSEERFVTLMNEKASRIGAENTWFINASGLPGPGQHITAFDLAKIMKEALKYPLIREIISLKEEEVVSEGGRRLLLRNTNHLLWSDDEVLGGKTGYTRAAGHCFVCAAKRGDNMLISAVLGEGVRDNLWRDSNGLLARGYDVIAQKSEPVIYLSAVSDKPVVLASYRNVKGKKKFRVARHKRIKRVKASDDDDTTAVNAVEKKHVEKKHVGKKHVKKKKNSRVKVAKKGKKTARGRVAKKGVKASDKSLS